MTSVLLFTKLLMQKVHPNSPGLLYSSLITEIQDQVPPGVTMRAAISPDVHCTRGHECRMSGDKTLSLAM